MNRAILTTSLLLAGLYSFSQGLYFNISGGYGAPALQQTQQAITFQPTSTDPAYSIIVPMNNQNISDSASAKFKTNLYQGYTNGGNINAVVGYMITHYIGVEVGFGSLIGKKIYGTSTFDDAILGDNVTIKSTSYSYGITMSPGIRLQACKPDAKIVPHGRFAISLPFWGATKHELDIKGNNLPIGPNLKFPAHAQVHTTTESVFSVGFNGSVGVGYNITKWLRVYGEAIAQYLFVRSGTTTITKYTLKVGEEPEANRLEDLSTYSTVTEFVDELNEGSNTEIFGKRRNPTNNPNATNVVDENRPRQELRRTANFSAFGGVVGLTFTINNKMWKKKKKPVAVHPTN